jgi:1,2-diacylglycerol 3-alpha-glucosyltransferase
MLQQQTVIMVTNNYTPYSGGVVSSIMVTAKALRQAGWKVVIVTLDFLGDGNEEEDVIRLYCPLRCMYRNNHMALPWMPEKKLREIFEKYKPSVVHVHHPFLLGAAAAEIARSCQIPVVFTYHTLYEHYLHYVPLVPTWLLKPLVIKQLTNFCANVTTIVPSLSLQIYTAQQHKTAAHIVPSAILEVFMCEEESAKRVDTPLELITVSRFMPEKNIPFLLDVMKQLDDRYCLTLIGYGAHQQTLEQYAYVTLALSPERIRFLVKPPKETIAQWYTKAHLFVFASQSETQGLVLAESMAAGTPVVALRGPGVVDIIEDGKNGFVVDSVDEMVEQIGAIFRDTVLYTKLQEGAYTTARNYYPKNSINKLLDVYKAVVKEL